MNLRRKLLSFVFVAFASSLFVSPSYSNVSEGPCKADVEKFCGTVTGRKEKKMCLMSHQSQLSPACQEKIEKMKARRAALQKDCSADAQKFCASAGDDFWAQKKCLKGHENEVSAACKPHLQHRKK